MSTIAVVLLRAVNVGGRNKLPMARFRDVLADAGFANVRTYIQSGNAVVESPVEDAASISAAVHDALVAGVGLDLDVMVRTLAGLAMAVSSNPFLTEGASPEHLHLICCNGAPTIPFDVAAFAPESAKVVGPNVYLLLPNGVGRSKFALEVSKRLGVPGTMRNWRTMSALLALADNSKENETS